MVVTNVTGWSELLDGNVVGSAFQLYNVFFNGYFVFMLFVVFQLMLLIKTRNLVLSFTTGLIFAAMWYTSSVIPAMSQNLMIMMLVFELAGIIVMFFTGFGERYKPR